MKALFRTPCCVLIAAAAVSLSAPMSVAQEGLQVKQKSSISMGRLGGGELQQTLMIRGTDRHKVVTEGRMRILVINRDASGTDIVRLDEGQIYSLDTRRKQYSTQALPDMRAQLEKSRNDLQAAANPQASDENVRMWVTGGQVERTGERRSINGFDTERAVIKMIVMGEDRRTNEEAELFYITADLWLDPGQRDASRINRDFYRAYVQQLGLDPRGAGNPFGQWFENLYESMDKMDGYPILSNLVFEAPGSGEAADGQQANRDEAARSGTDPVGAAIGGLMRRASRARQEEAPVNPAATPGRSLLFSSTTEVTSISTTAPDEAEFAPPADFRKR